MQSIYICFYPFCRVAAELHPLVEEFISLDAVIPKRDAFIDGTKQKLGFGAEWGERKTHSLDRPRQGAACFNC